MSSVIVGVDDGVAKVPGDGDSGAAVIGAKGRVPAQFAKEKLPLARADRGVVVENQAGGQHILDDQVVDGSFRGAQRQGIGDRVADGRFCDSAVTLADGDAGDGEFGRIDITVGIEPRRRPENRRRRLRHRPVRWLHPGQLLSRLDQSASTVLTWLPSTTAALVTAGRIGEDQGTWPGSRSQASSLKVMTEPSPLAVAVPRLVSVPSIWAVRIAPKAVPWARVSLKLTS